MLRNYLQNTAFRVKAAICDQRPDRRPYFQEYKTLKENILPTEFASLLKLFPAGLILPETV